MKKSEIKRGVVLSYAQIALGMIISIIYTPIMIRILGQSEYGIYNIAASVISYLGILDFGFGSSYIRYYSINKKENDYKAISRLNGLFLFVFIIIAIICLFAGFILSLNVDLFFSKSLTGEELNLTKVLMIISSVNLAISFPTSLFVSYITAQEKFVFLKLVNMIRTIMGPLVTLPLLLLGYKSIGVVVTMTLITALTTLVNIYFCIVKLKMKISFKDLDINLLKDISAFSGFIAINIIVDQINWNLDKFLLGRYQGSIATSIYAVASTLNGYYRNIAVSITSVFTPRIHKLINKKNSMDEVTKLFTKVGRIQFLISMMICTGFIFFGQAFIKFWVGNDYSGAYWIALLLIVPVTIPLIQGLGLEIQRAKYMHKFRSIVYLLSAIINLLISIPLCKAYGGVGSALGTAISILLTNGLIMNVYYHKKIELNIIYFWRGILSILPGLLLPILYGIIVFYKANLDILLYFVLYGVGYIIVYLVSMWILGMNKYEKDLFINIFNKFVKK